LLTVNLKDGYYISIPMLFAYLFCLDLTGSSVVVLIVSTSRRLTSRADVRREDVVGVIKGQAVLRTFRRLFPDLNTISARVASPEVFAVRNVNSIPTEHVLQSWYESIRGSFRESRSEFLTQSTVQVWFPDLNKESVDVALSSNDIGKIKDALRRADDFILAFERGTLNSIVPVCRLASRISVKTLKQIA
jgi:hypothetical protein